MEARKKKERRKGEETCCLLAFWNSFVFASSSDLSHSACFSASSFSCSTWLSRSYSFNHVGFSFFLFSFFLFWFCKLARPLTDSDESFDSCSESFCVKVRISWRPSLFLCRHFLPSAYDWNNLLYYISFSIKIGKEQASLKRKKGEYRNLQIDQALLAIFEWMQGRPPALF